MFKNKNKIEKSLIFSLTIIVFVLSFASMSLLSLAIPDVEHEIKKDLNNGITQLVKGDAHEYYNLYNTRRLTEIDKSKFYDKIRKTTEILDSEKSLYFKHKFNLKVNKVTVIEKLEDNVFLCGVNATVKYRKDIKSTETLINTSNYILKIIDVGNMDYKILLPFNSLDSDFSQSFVFNELQKSSSKKLALEVKKKREDDEKKKKDMEKEEETNLNKESENVQIIEDSNDAKKNTNKKEESSKPLDSSSDKNTNKVDNEESEEDKKEDKNTSGDDNREEDKNNSESE